jgi:hypothetical protein
VTLLSAAALAYEILLMRLFSIIQWHHFAYMFIGLALLGYGFSGNMVAIYKHRLLPRFNNLYISSIALFGISAINCFSLAQHIPFNAEVILWDGWQVFYLAFIFLLLAIPFFFAATAICLSFLQYDRQVSHVYAVDLLGAGIGSLGIIILLFWVYPQFALVIVSVLGVIAALIAIYELQVKQQSKITLALMSIIILLLVSGIPLKLHLSPYKSLEQVLRITGTNIISQGSSPLGLISVVESRDIPFRHAPGQSLHATQEPLQQLGVFTDGDNMTVLTRYPDDINKLSYLDQNSSALPYHLKPINHALIVGVGGGADVLQAKYNQVEQIDGVELNQQMIQLVNNNYSSFTGNLFQQPGVTIHHSEVRDFLSREARRYDLIQLALMDAFNASASGLYALNESYLYTVEALQLYLNNLNTDGYLALTRWIKLPPRDTVKLFATAVAALRENGVNDPEQNLVLIRSWQTSTLLIKNGQFTNKELSSVQKFCDERGFDMAYTPGLKPEQVNQYNILSNPVFYQAATALLNEKPDDFMRQYKFNVYPATDDQPYFYQFFRWSTFEEIFHKRNKGGMALVEWGYITLLITLAIASLISVMLIILPLWYYQRQQIVKNSSVKRRDVFYYFFAIGLAFLFIEIALMQKFILFLHQPIYAISITLTAFLIFAGVGSYLSGIISRTQSNAKILLYAISGVIVLSMCYLLSLDTIFTMLVSLPVGIKMLIAIILIAPLAICMGMPFPLALTSLAEHAKYYIPWAWGINGFASVISAVLATLLAIHFGFSTVILLAILLYGSVILTFPRPIKNEK